MPTARLTVPASNHRIHSDVPTARDNNGAISNIDTDTSDYYTDHNLDIEHWDDVQLTTEIQAGSYCFNRAISHSLKLVVELGGLLG